LGVTPIENLRFRVVDATNLEPALGNIQSDADDLRHDVEPFAFPVGKSTVPAPSLYAQAGAVHIISSAADEAGISQPAWSSVGGKLIQPATLAPAG